MDGTRWEYLTAHIDVSGFFGPSIDVHQLAADFNGFGKDGWELVSVVDVNRGQGRTSALLAVFKRPAA